ncbi:MAG: hypothetical protein WC997_02285 [Porticoccaceae bacterium]
MTHKNIIPDEAVGFQVQRIMREREVELRAYTPIQFTTERPAQSCRLYYTRCRVFSGVHEGSAETSAGICDVLDKDGDIIGDFLLNRKGIKWLIKALGATVEPDFYADNGQGGGE